MKHTQGEWKVVGNDFGYATSIKTTERTICSMRVNNQIECNANAKLIAAAPELLEALQELIGYTKATLKEHGIPFFDDLGETCNTAILKATE